MVKPLSADMELALSALPASGARDCVRGHLEALAAELTVCKLLLSEWQIEVTERDTRIAELESALRAEIAAIHAHGTGATHFPDCWKTHRLCAAVRRMEMALKREGEPK
jgi:hypothetical protein